MRSTTAELWAEQDRHPGDRHRLFRAVAEVVEAERVLYPGSWCDVAASFVWPNVTYVDSDRRAARFFDDDVGVREIVAAAGRSVGVGIDFLAADYTEPLPLDPESFDLLISMYAGPLSGYCTRYLRVGGVLLANTSHGEVALAALDPRYELAGVVSSQGGGHRVSQVDLDTYLVPRRPTEVTRDEIERTGRGVAYTRPAAAYLFRRVE